MKITKGNTYSIFDKTNSTYKNGKLVTPVYVTGVCVEIISTEKGWERSSFLMPDGSVRTFYHSAIESEIVTDDVVPPSIGDVVKSIPTVGTKPHRVEEIGSDITIEQATAWLNANADLLNLKEISRLINTDMGTLHRAVYGKPDYMGRKVKIPNRCLPELVKIISSLRYDG